MSASTIRRRITSRLARIGTTLALVAGLSAVVSFGGAQTASAEQSCPATPVQGITQWIEQYKDRGVTVCWGMETSGGLPQLAAVVQVVDLADGANLSVASFPNCPCGPPSAGQLYSKDTVDIWQEIYQTPGEELFSTTNAGFFKDSSSNPSTALSLPDVWGGRIWSYGMPSAFDLTLAKVSLTMGLPDSGFQTVKLRDFPANYTAAHVNSHYPGCGTDPLCPASYYGTVGFHPAANLTGNPDDISRRTMLGVNAQVNVAASRVYILTTTRSYRLADARQILKHFGSQYEMQLDGGGSTQSISEYHQIDSTVFRPVPQVLQVWLGN
ncbi:hypothetical protein [Jiangella anatolica]|uniref:Phosphodiester glycosidase domain-containing protein n=1 Tax=Jiangella anatolica TaxID=2670374 RepID=A0A2W2CNA3_9ACTN|nr:hypothetical protein [Jiangella anatolica]PZF86676.1 hypothetical protein C1I92_00435 [Jiangella anatolica]